MRPFRRRRRGRIFRFLRITAMGIWRHCAIHAIENQKHSLQYDPLSIGRDQSMWPLLYLLPETKKPTSAETGVGPMAMDTVSLLADQDDARERPIRIPMVPDEIPVEKTSPIPLPETNVRATKERRTCSGQQLCLDLMFFTFLMITILYITYVVVEYPKRQI